MHTIHILPRIPLITAFARLFPYPFTKVNPLSNLQVLKASRPNCSDHSRTGIWGRSTENYPPVEKLAISTTPSYSPMSGKYMCAPTAISAIPFPFLSFLLRLGRYTIEEALKCSNKIQQGIPLYPLVTGICQVSVDLNTLSRFYPRNEEFGRYASTLLTKQQRALPNPQETLVSSFQTETSTMCSPLQRKRAAMECLNYQNRPTQTCNFS